MLAVRHGGIRIRIKFSAAQFIHLLALRAVENLRLTGICTENTVPTPAISTDATDGRRQPMNDAYRTRLEQYLSSMLQAKRMLSVGIISPEDYAKADTILSKKYGLESCNLYRGIDLLYSEVRGNMSHYEEGTLCQE